MPFALAQVLPGAGSEAPGVTTIPEEASPVTSYALAGNRILDAATGGCIEVSKVSVDGALGASARRDRSGYLLECTIETAVSVTEGLLQRVSPRTACADSQSG